MRRVLRTLLAASAPLALLAAAFLPESPAAARQLLGTGLSGTYGGVYPCWARG